MSDLNLIVDLGVSEKCARYPQMANLVGKIMIIQWV
jgi:hypothetical protein